MSHIFRLFVAICFGMFIFSASSIASTADSDIGKLITKLKPHFPDIANADVSVTPIDQLFQISSGPNILYVTVDGRYVISGEIIDLDDNKTNITENSRKTARLAVLKGVGNENMITFSPKNPKHIVTVFTDIDCGYCRKLHADIAKLNSLGIAIRYLAFPRGGPGSRGFDRTVSVWCADDKQMAINLAKQGKPVKEKICMTHKVDEQFRLGLRLGVSGTPTMILSDGTMLPGYVPPEKLLELLEHRVG